MKGLSFKILINGVEMPEPKPVVMANCIFCESLYDINNLHPKHIARCGQEPKWCRDCDYVFSHYASILTDDLLVKIENRKKTVAAPVICDFCGKRYNLLKHFFLQKDYYDPLAPAYYTGGIDFLYPNLFLNLCYDCFFKFFQPKWFFNFPYTETLNAVRATGELIGKLPTKDFPSYLYNFSTAESVRRFVELLFLLPTPDETSIRFGSFFKLLISSGLLPEGTRRMRIGTLVLADDNDLCYSLVEREIDNWLFKHKVLHNKESFYPGSSLRCDWEILNTKQRTFVEYFGLMSMAPYAAKVIQKKEIANTNGILLIEIYPETDWRKVFTDAFLNS